MTKAPTVADTIASRVRKYRQERGWSIRELAERCTSTGASTLTQASLTNIERGLSASSGRGSRAVTVTELLSLAFVMEVPPVMLMLPLGEHDEVEACPGLTLRSLDLMRWLVAYDSVGGRLLDGGPSEAPDSYLRASGELRLLVDIERTRDLARRTWDMLHGDPEPLIELRQVIESRWEANPSQRAYLEAAADMNNRPRPGQGMSDEEFVAQWRETLPSLYRSRLREYVDAMWQAADAGIAVLPPVPRQMYVDIMKFAADDAPPGWKWDVDPLTGLPREVATPVRPVLPPNILIEVPDGDHDGNG